MIELVSTIRQNSLPEEQKKNPLMKTHILKEIVLAFYAQVLVRGKYCVYFFFGF